MEGSWTDATFYCGYRPQPNDPTNPPKVPVEALKAFYTKLTERSFEDPDPCLNLPKGPDQCVIAEGYWESLAWWECRGGPLTPQTLTFPISEKRYGSIDNDYGLCFYQLQGNQAKLNSLPSHLMNERKIPVATSSTPECIIPTDSDDGPVLLCSYAPEENPGRLGSVPKEVIEKYKGAFYRSKGMDKGKDKKCSNNYTGEDPKAVTTDFSGNVVHSSAVPKGISKNFVLVVGSCLGLGRALLCGLEKI